MAKLLRLRRGTDTQHTTFTGAEGEVTVNTTNDSLHVHDGTTAGGTEMAKADLSNAAGASIPGTLTVNQLIVDDDGSGSPTVRISGDDDGPWGLVVNNNNVQTDNNHGLRVQQANDGDIEIHIGGNGVYEELNLYTSDGSGSGPTDLAVKIGADRAFNAYYQGSHKLATTSGGINVTGTVTTDGLTSTGTNVLENTDEPQLILRDTDSSGSAARVQLEARGSDNVVDWFVGHTSTSNGSVTFMNEDSQPIYFGVGGSPRFELSASGHLVPQATNFYDLGTSANQWRDGYFDGVVNCDAVTCEGTALINSPTGQLVIRDSDSTGDAVVAKISGQASDGTQYWGLGHVSAGNDILYIQNKRTDGIMFETSGADRVFIDDAGHLRPWTNNTYDLGSNSYRWRNVYTNDLNLSNEGGSNDVDGTWGSWTIQEGEDDLFLLNRRNGKKYKFNLSEVN